VPDRWTDPDPPLVSGRNAITYCYCFVLSIGLQDQRDRAKNPRDCLAEYQGTAATGS